MPIPYNSEFRERVIAVMKHGGTIINTAKRFKVSESTVRRYWEQHNEIGNISPKKRPEIRKRKVNYDEVLEYVNNHSDQTLKEIGEVFKISAQTVSRIFRKLNYTFKKKVYFMSKEMKKKEPNLKKK
jgi:transposase